MNALLNKSSQHVGFEHLPTTRPLRVKLGMDPTAPDLHLGHAVLLRKLREFQDAGHHAILVVGSFTAQIGDPTGKNKTRPPLTAEDVAENAKTYITQAFKILDPAKTEVVYNDAWLAKMTAVELVSMMAKVTTSQLLARDDFSQRMKANEPIAMHELLYPMMQAMDSVVLKADVELGGSDQWFNLHMGRALQEKSNQAPQAILTMPLLVGLDGVHKMSKSLNNHIGIMADPIDSYGRFMSMSDEAMWTMLPLLNIAQDNEIAKWKDACANGLENPMHVKKDCAMRVLTQLHGIEKAQEAKEAFEARHNKGAVVHEPRTMTLDAEKNTKLVTTLLKELNFASSSSDAGRKMEQGGVRINGVKEMDKQKLLAAGTYIVEVGKRQSCHLTLTSGPETNCDLR